MVRGDYWVEFGAADVGDWRMGLDKAVLLDDCWGAFYCVKASRCTKVVLEMSVVLKSYSFEVFLLWRGQFRVV